MGILQTTSWRSKCYPISSYIIIIMGNTFKYITYHIFVLVISSFKICNEMWTTWNIEFGYLKCKTIWFTKYIKNTITINF
jgi:hypothetical protein